MGSMLVKFKRPAIRQLALTGEEISRVIDERTHAIGAHLAAEIGPESVEIAVGGRSRRRGYVRRVGAMALAEEGRDAALARALRNAR